MALKIKQEYWYQGADQWKWSVWLDAPESELREIDHVVYTLHPSFSSPVRRIETAKNGFRLNSSGWGQFKMYLQIVGKDGRIRKRTHLLELAYPDTSEPVVVASKGKKWARRMRQSPRHATPDPVERNTRLFISSSATDADLVARLAQALRDRDVEVVTEDSLPHARPSVNNVLAAIIEADALVAIIAGRVSLWLHQEIESATASGKPVVVVSPPGAKTQPIGGELGIVQMHSINDVDSVASTIVRRTAPKKGVLRPNS